MLYFINYSLLDKLISIDSFSINFDFLLYLTNRIRITTMIIIIMKISIRMIPSKTIFLSDFFSFLLLFSTKVLVKNTSEFDDIIVSILSNSSEYIKVELSEKYLLEVNVELGEKYLLEVNEELVVNSELHE